MNTPKGLESLLDRLTQHERIDVLDGSSLADDIKVREKVLVGFFSDPAIHPENLDLAIILPELLKVFPSLNAVVPKTCAPMELARQFGASVFPALVLVKAGQPVQALERIRSWPEYASSIQQFLG